MCNNQQSALCRHEPGDGGKGGGDAAAPHTEAGQGWRVKPAPRMYLVSPLKQPEPPVQFKTCYMRFYDGRTAESKSRTLGQAYSGFACV